MPAKTTMYVKVSPALVATRLLMDLEEALIHIRSMADDCDAIEYTPKGLRALRQAVKLANALDGHLTLLAEGDSDR